MMKGLFSDDNIYFSYADCRSVIYVLLLTPHSITGLSPFHFIRGSPLLIASAIPVLGKICPLHYT